MLNNSIVSHKCYMHLKVLNSIDPKHGKLKPYTDSFNVTKLISIIIVFLLVHLLPSLGVHICYPCCSINVILRLNSS